MDNQALLWPKNKDLKFANVIGVRDWRLYKVPSKYIQVVVHHTIIPYKLWHKRLGHLHYKALPGLRRMVNGMPIFDFEHDSVCRGCALGNNVKIVSLVVILDLKGF